MRKPAVPQRIADALPRLRIYQRDHEIDDVPRSAELAGSTRDREL